MPPSPALRFSPSRELNHKRGRSLEGGLHLKEKDDELALFAEMQNRERESFLIHLSDDIESSLPTKLKHLSEFKLGVNIRARGESSDLLCTDGDKNDYDWLLTPPDTPLFRSLDDEDEKPPPNLVQRGRPRSQPIYISRTSMTEKSIRSGRSSASPNRLSPSPRSSNNSYMSRGRPSSASHTSPGPFLRSGTPTKRPTSPNNPSTTTPRSSTPTLRRMSTGSSANPSSAGKSGTSPGKVTRGNSASPKLRAWQTALPGFSLDPPPNLRTSISDRPASHVRGSSPASRSSKDASFSKYRRQSMSPTASRSASSSRSFDPDRFSSHSKGSVVSSGDDDTDSLQSVPVMLPQQYTTRNPGSVFKSRNIGFSKRPNKTFSASSAPKRSFEYAIRQMDNHKGPQNMFRPLLSSVPSSTFYSGKANPAHSAIMSMSSSITTSSNASSEPGVSVTLDAEGNEHDRDDSKSEWLKSQYPENQDDEIFVLDSVDEGNRIVNVDGGIAAEQHGDFGESTSNQAETTYDPEINGNRPSIDIGIDSLLVGDDISKVVSGNLVVVCSVCFRKFENLGHVNDDSYVCPSCSARCRLIAESPATPASVSCDNITSEIKMEINTAVEKNFDGAVVKMPIESSFLDGCSSQVMLPSLDNFKEKGHSLKNPESMDSQELCTDDSGSMKLEQQPCSINGLLSSKTDTSEGLGMSVLLKRSNSTKWPVVQGRSFTATTISCDNLSFTRESLNCRSYSVEGGASASSSIDLNSHTQQHLGGKKVDMKIVREDFNRMFLSSRSSVSGCSDSCYEATVYSEGFVEDRIDEAARNLGIEVVEDSGFVAKECDVLEVKEPDHLREVDCCASDLSSSAHHIDVKGSLVVQGGSNQDCDNFNTSELFPDNKIALEAAKSHVHIENNEIEADTENCSAPCLDDICDPLQSNKMEHKDDCKVDRPVDADASQHSESTACVPEQPLPSSISEEDDLPPASEANVINGSNDINEKPVVEIGNQGHQSRSLTLDEATDAILFCSSIVHNLAYEAASIAIERESPVIPLEVCRASKVSHFARFSMRDSNNYLRPKAAKTKHKQAELAVKPTLQKPDNRAQDQGILTQKSQNLVVSHKPDSMKPPKLESKCNCTIM